MLYRNRQTKRSTVDPRIEGGNMKIERLTRGTWSDFLEQTNDSRSLGREREMSRATHFTMEATCFGMTRFTRR